jgi:hypothetical protein
VGETEREVEREGGREGEREERERERERERESTRTFTWSQQIRALTVEIVLNSNTSSCSWSS